MIYVASSWRNEYQQNLIRELRGRGFNVYDFKNPGFGMHGFSWSEIDRHWLDMREVEYWTPERYKKALNHTLAKAGFERDYNAMKKSSTCILLLPCGRSAHTEAGWMKGQGKKVYVIMPIKQEPELIKQEPELMYKIYDEIFIDFPSLFKQLQKDEN